jgi:hypothetical protein
VRSPTAISNAVAVALLIGSVACGGAACGSGLPEARVEVARPLLARLVADLPPGADQCVVTAPHLVSDRRRALLAELTDADALGWARTPHVAAYVRCRYRSRRESIVWRMLIDGELDREVLPMHVRWEGDACEADACDWPVAAWDGSILSLRSPDTDAVRGVGVEVELRALVARMPQLLEARLTGESLRLRTLEDDGVRELRRGSARRELVLSWEEMEVLAADHRIRRERTLARASERLLDGEALDWSDGDAIAAQLELRRARVSRRSAARRGAAGEELARFALRAIEERGADARVLDLALRALVEVGRIDDALARADRAAIECDFDPERARAMRALGWELAVRGDSPTAAQRLVDAGLARDPDDARGLAPLLAEALDREVVGPTSRTDVESEVLRLAALAVPGPLVALERPIAMSPVGVLPALVALVTMEPEANTIEVAAWLDVDVPVATIAVIPAGPRLSILPGRAMHALHVGGPLEVLETAAEALRAPGDGPFALELRLGAVDAPQQIVRIEGRIRRGRLSLERVSPALARWDWPRIARHLVEVFGDSLAPRFPASDLSWSGESAELLDQVGSELSMMHLAECNVSPERVVCTPRAGRSRDAIIAAARALQVLPPH